MLECEEAERLKLPRPLNDKKNKYLFFLSSFSHSSFLLVDFASKKEEEREICQKGNPISM
jgi:hypothetical protein